MTEPHIDHDWEYLYSSTKVDENGFSDGTSYYRCRCGETMELYLRSIGQPATTRYEFKVILTVAGRDETIDRPTLNLELCDLLAQHPKVKDANAPLLDTFPNPFRYKDSSNSANR